MNRISLKLLTVCGITCFMACTTTQKPKTEKWSERIARSEMKRFPEPWMIEKASKPRWGYTHGLVVKSMLEEWKHTGDSTYYDYAKIYADSLIDNDGHIRTMKYLSFNIDNVNAGKILLTHADEADGAQIEQTIAHLNRAMAQIGCKRRFDTEIVKKGTIQLTNSDLESFSRCGYVYENYQKMDLSEQNGFQSLYFMNSTMSKETLKAAVKKLFEDENCGNIFRIKGFLKADNDKWLELNATHSKITLQPIAEGQDVLIVIGERLNKEAVESYIQSDRFRM